MYLFAKREEVIFIPERHLVFVAIQVGEDVGDFYTYREALKQGFIDRQPARYKYEVVGRGEKKVEIWANDAGWWQATDAVEDAYYLNMYDFKTRKISYYSFGYHCSLQDDPPDAPFWQWSMTLPMH